jgi:hypothetical protein
MKNIIAFITLFLTLATSAISPIFHEPVKQTIIDKHIESNRSLPILLDSTIHVKAPAIPELWPEDREKIIVPTASYFFFEATKCFKQNLKPYLCLLSPRAPPTA